MMKQDVFLILILQSKLLKFCLIKCKLNLRKKENLEIFTKRCFADVPLEQLSADYNRKKNEISLIVSRLHKKYKAIFDEVVEEMDSEQMKQSNISIDFLSPIVDFPISA